MLDDNGHGDEPTIGEELVEVGAYQRLEDMKRGDGTLVSMDQHQLGVLQKLVTAPKGKENYRQLLLTGYFPSEARATKAVMSIHELKNLNVDFEIILDHIASQCGVKGKGRDPRSEQIMNTLTHTYISSNRFGFKKNDNKNNPRGTISQ